MAGPMKLCSLALYGMEGGQDQKMMTSKPYKVMRTLQTCIWGRKSASVNRPGCATCAVIPCDGPDVRLKQRLIRTLSSWARLKENENASLSTCFKETSNALAWPKFVRGAGMRFARSLRIAIRHGSADPQLAQGSAYCKFGKPP